MSNWSYLKQFLNKGGWTHECPIEFHAGLFDYIVTNKDNIDALDVLFSCGKIEEYWVDMLENKDITSKAFAWVVDEMTKILFLSLNEEVASHLTDKVCTLRLCHEILLCADRIHAIQLDSTNNPIVSLILTYFELALQVPTVGTVIAKEKPLEIFLHALFSPQYDGQRSHLNDELKIVCFHHLLMQEYDGTNVPSTMTTINSKWTKREWKILFDTIKRGWDSRSGIRTALAVVASIELLRAICYDRRNNRTDPCCPAYLELGLMDIVMKIYKKTDQIYRPYANALLSMFVTYLGDFSYCGEILNTTGLLSVLVKEVLSSDPFRHRVDEYTASGLLERSLKATQCIWFVVEYNFFAVAPILKSMNAHDIITPLLLSKQKYVVEMAKRILCKLKIYLDPEFLNPLQCALPGCLKDGKLMKCGGCKLVYYCSVEHQKQHWNAHKIQCNPKTRTEILRPKEEQKFICTFNRIQFNETFGDMVKKMDRSISLSTHLWVTDYSLDCGAGTSKWMTREEFLETVQKKHACDLSGILKQKFDLRATLHDGNNVVSAVLNLNREISTYVRVLNIPFNLNTEIHFSK
jgi:hypothetical protein